MTVMATLQANNNIYNTISHRKKSTNMEFNKKKQFTIHVYFMYQIKKNKIILNRW